jgi:hypothetical protein
MVNMSSAAPGQLESIRTLLNTWRIPNDTRQPVDELPDLLGDHDAWVAQLPGVRFPTTAADRRAVEHLRHRLRASLRGDDAEAVDELVSAQRWRLSVDIGHGSVRWSTDPATAAGDALAIVVDAVVAGTWGRLRSCPDCQWVFYDTSRNGRRVWCSMTAANGARACGSIAKTRAYRQRRRAVPPGLTGP